jgi:hypothetical protein
VGVELTIQLIGKSNNVVAEVDATYRATRSVMRSLDVQSGGSYRHSFNINSTCGDASTFVWYGFGSQDIAFAAVQWMGQHQSFVLKKALLNFGSASLFASGNPITFKMFQVSGFTQQLPTVQGSLGTVPCAVTKTMGHGNKLRGTFLDSDQGAIPFTLAGGSGNAAFGPGGTFWSWANLTATYTAVGSAALDNQFAAQSLFTQDAVPMGTLQFSGNNTIRDRLGQQTLFEADAGFPPLSLEATQGLVFKILAPLTTSTVLAFGLTLEWDEVPTYQLGINS